MSKRKILIPIIFLTVLIIVLIVVLNPSHKYNKISINESKWNSIRESRVESPNLVLEEISFNDYKLIIDKKNNTIYYSIVSDSKNKFNPTVSYNANSKNTKLAFLSDEITDEKIKNNHQFKLMIYTEKEYHIYNLKCTDFPLLNISYDENEESKQNNIPMELYLFDNLSNIPNKVTISSGKIKKNEEEIIFSLHMLTPGKNKRDNKISVLNMNPNSEYILTRINNTANNSKENKKHRVELFINNEYKGAYNLDAIENQLPKLNE